MASSTILVWFRRDLRLQDNPALHAALARGAAVIPIYIVDEAREGRWPPGVPARGWLHRSLAALGHSLRERGSRLLLARGAAAEILRDAAKSTDATAVFWNRGYEPAAAAHDARVEAELAAAKLEARSFRGALLHEPTTVANKQGRPFQVFTPFWRHCLALPVSPPLKLTEKTLPAPPTWPGSLALEELELLPRENGTSDCSAVWQPGEAAAQKRLRRFVLHGLERYAEERDRPADDGTSRLSPHLHFGELSPRQIWAAVRAAGRDRGVFPPSKGAAVFLAELGWREFAHHLLFHFPRSPEQPLRAAFARFPWADDPGAAKLRAWQRGQTGYPMVDAGMRQLERTGWMHHRARMIAASFLVKHLRLPWTQGAAWFWDTLVDADLANNTLGWQWSAGCGTDAAPYFRIFAPVRQGMKFDPEGNYVRRWVSELARMPAAHIHAPWQAPPAVLREAGVRLGENYPLPIVDHAPARAEALAAFRKLRGVSPG